MKTVLLLRHAKSSWDQLNLPDPLRPLAPRGRKAAPRIGSYMAENKLIPNMVLCSTARRAEETWQLVSDHLGDGIQVQMRDDIYHASPRRLMDLIQILPKTVDTVLLVGHNPTFEDLALTLAGSGQEEGLESMARKYPTGALAVIDFSVADWSQIRAGEGYLRDFVRPRSLQR